MFRQAHLCRRICRREDGSATGFSPSVRKLDNLPYVHVLYAYDHRDGSTLAIEHNNTTYLGGEMKDSLCNPIQSEEAGTKVDIRPRYSYKNRDGLQSLTFPNGTVIPILYDGVLPFIPIRRPRPFFSCRRNQLTSRDDWDPYHHKNRFAVLAGKLNSKMSLSYINPISLELMSCKLKESSSSHQLLSRVNYRRYII